MTEKHKTLLVHAGCIALIALCVWLSTLIKGTDDLALELRAALVGSALFLWGKLGFKPASPVLDRIVQRLVEREPVRMARLTSKPPPAAAGARIPPEGFTEVHAPDGSVVAYAKKQPPTEPQP